MNIRFSNRLVILVTLSVLFVTGTARAQARDALTLNDEARFLAGLPVSPGSALAALETSRVGRDHAAAIDKEWDDLESIRLRAMEQWATTELQPRIDEALPLVYLFGGPDFVSADVLYPTAPVYVLGGLEPVGAVPPLAAMKPEALSAGLENLRDSLRTILRLSHFITDEMASELRRTELKGVLPLLYLFVVRSGHELLGTDAVYIDRGGNLVESRSAAIPADGVPGVRITFRSLRGGATRSLYLLSDGSRECERACQTRILQVPAGTGSPELLSEGGVVHPAQQGVLIDA